MTQQTQHTVRDALRPLDNFVDQAANEGRSDMAQYRYTTTTGEDPRLIDEVRAEQIIARPHVSEPFETDLPHHISYDNWRLITSWEVYPEGTNPDDLPDGDATADRVERAPDGYRWTPDAERLEPICLPVIVVAEFDGELEEMEEMEAVEHLDAAMTTVEDNGYIIYGPCETTSSWDPERLVHLIVVNPRKAELLDAIEAHGQAFAAWYDHGWAERAEVVEENGGFICVYLSSGSMSATEAINGYPGELKECYGRNGWKTVDEALEAFLDARYHGKWGSYREFAEQSLHATTHAPNQEVTGVDYMVHAWDLRKEGYFGVTDGNGDCHVFCVNDEEA